MYHLLITIDWTMGTFERLRLASCWRFVVGCMMTVILPSQTEMLSEADVLRLQVLMPCRLKFGHKNPN